VPAAGALPDVGGTWSGMGGGSTLVAGFVEAALPTPAADTTGTGNRRLGRAE